MSDTIERKEFRLQLSKHEVQSVRSALLRVIRHRQKEKLRRPFTGAGFDVAQAAIDNCLAAIRQIEAQMNGDQKPAA
jgi:hypothetical protein